MAILVVGGQCSLRGKPMLEGEKTVRFSPFVSNEADPLWKFSDGAFHEECFRRDPLAKAAEQRWPGGERPPPASPAAVPRVRRGNRQP